MQGRFRAIRWRRAGKPCGDWVRLLFLQTAHFQRALHFLQELIHGDFLAQIALVQRANGLALLHLELSSQVQQRIEENLKRGLPAEAFARSTVEFGNEGCYLSLAEVLHINRLGTVFTD